MKINCDMGESYGLWKLGNDEEIMPYIHMANIACGMHASDPLVMHKTVALAKKHGVMVGAHPGYDDKQGFGRRNMDLPTLELQSLFLYQIGALKAICDGMDYPLCYVKPHGALYNQMMQDAAVFETLIQALSCYDASLPMLIMAGGKSEQYTQIAQKYGASLMFEAFVDRAYTSDGYLAPRQLQGACHHDINIIHQQAQSITDDKKVQTIDGNTLALHADTICIHGDGALAVQIAKILHKELA